MRVVQLYTYPIKSIRGFSINSAQATQHGFPYDRRFMLLKDHHDDTSKSPQGTRFQNMHVPHFPEMCLFTTAVTWPSADEPHGGTIHVTYTEPKDKSTASIDVPLQPDFQNLATLPVNMHQSRCTAYNMGASYNEWFSSHFGFDVVFVYLGESYRPVLGNIAPDAAVRNPVRIQQQARQSSWFGSITSRIPTILGGAPSDESEEDYHITFQDCSPFLIVSKTSVDSVSTRFPEGTHVDVTKFRPNIVVEGAEEPWEEDYWAELTFRGGESVFALTSNCARCASLNVDYNTGRPAVGPEGQLLKKLQADRRVDKGSKYNPIFGRYGFLKRETDASDEQHVISVGDQVEVSKRNTERTTFKWPGIGVTPKEELYSL